MSSAVDLAYITRIS